MQDHPNAVVALICSKAGIALRRGDAARIHGEVPDLDRTRILDVARQLSEVPRPDPAPRSTPAPKPAKAKKSRKPAPFPARVAAAVRLALDGLLVENPDLQAHRAMLAERLKEDVVARLMGGVLDRDGETIHPVNVVTSFERVAGPLRERIAMNAWLDGLRPAGPILRRLLTPEIWRTGSGDPAALEAELVRRTNEALQEIGGQLFPDPDVLSRVLQTPLPPEGEDPLAADRARWEKVWSATLPEIERDSVTVVKRRPFRLTRLRLLGRMFPKLGGEGDLETRVETLAGLVAQREADQDMRARREAQLRQERKRFEASLIRRDELETRLPATKAETLRWIGDGRIPVAHRKDFHKWGRDLQVTMHDPRLLTEWQAQVETWRRDDRAAAAAARAEVQRGRALATRVTNLVAAALPEGVTLGGVEPVSTPVPAVAVDLYAPVPLRLRANEADPMLTVPMRIRLEEEDWSAVADGPATAAARRGAVERLRAVLDIRIAEYRALAGPTLADLEISLAESLAHLPDAMLGTWRREIEAAFREQEDLRHLRAAEGGFDGWYHPRRLADRIRRRANDVGSRLDRLHRDWLLRRASGLDDYPALFPAARALKRQLHLHLGPTNSGKTHAAMERLMQAECGLYAAPLRLMAMEWAERLNAEGVPTDLVTGEEVQRLPGARHSSVTIEMCPMRAPIDVAIIDEAQMIADPERGWAWTQAILGLPAREIRLTGSPDAEPWVRALAALTGDEVHVHRHDRLMPLETMAAPVAPAELRPGDAVVAFSRASVLRLREEVQARGRTVATVYGALSPEVRREEARRFRSGEADVLVATDAIGMGLNLPIRRVLFSEGSKFDGTIRRALNGNEIRQIAGRAGRFGLSEAEIGEAGCYRSGRMSEGEATSDLLGRIDAALRDTPRLPKTVRPRVKPGAEVVQLVGEIMGTGRLELILSKIHHDILEVHDLFLSGISEEMLLLARLLDGTRLGLDERHAYTGAPVDTRDEIVWSAFVDWVRTHAKGSPVAFKGRSFQWRKTLRTHADLADAESMVKAAGVYLWCSLRWPDVYTEAEEATAGRQRLNAAISAALSRKDLKRSCRSCGRPLPDGHRFGICDRCHEEERFIHSW
ncbi:hypothetical protein LAZ40_07205 [Cereibacter sphaeroides]|uniref:helicase-related protein n=1 Tax=Cereibacter sphaeroides TaxID=1063 RepID=UPI001F18D05A|nr:helicase-related protein [Cereibacter sphaeroides]MCE6958835.1 hypothetical protein [Cereibacter sphaeroides]MCE6973291.1 hypothetical protein [Cereibacter sphaeroides]